MDVTRPNEIVEDKAIISDYGNCNMKVIVRVRPASEAERYSCYKIVVNVVDDHIIIFDPKKQGSSGRQRMKSIMERKPKDLRLAFDKVCDQYATQVDVFEASTKPLVDGVMNGINCSVFAYGATGAGKTYTMLGNPDNPGVTFLTMMELFKRINQAKDDKICTVSVSYLEIYNEQVKDLIKPSGTLDVREDSCSGITVNGLSWHKPQAAGELFELLERGNRNRIQHPTDTNSNSSRSHAVFQVVVEQKPRSADFSTVITRSKMLLVDLAGSERALVTTNRGMRLKEGANINKSLLALGNCINALSSAADKQSVNITYRNSKLTRLLKDSLGGNCHTVMIVNISPSSLSYEETYNSLKYADRAKHIKTKLVKNVVNVDFHLSNYQQIVKQLQNEVSELKEKLNAGRGNNEEFDYSIAAKIEGEANSIFDERMRLRKEMTKHDASEQDAKYKVSCRQHDIEHCKLLKASQGRSVKLEAKISSLQRFLKQTELNKQSVHQLLLRNNKELNKLQMDINTVTMENPRSAATKKFLDKVMEHKRLQSECFQQRQQLKYYHKLMREYEKESQKTERMLKLALEVIVEMKPSNGKAKANFDALMRLVEGEKEVAWAEHQNSVILPHTAAPHLADDNMENNISPAFLQSSGILICHNASFDTTQQYETTTVVNNDSDSYTIEMLNSSYPKKVNVSGTDDSDATSIATSSFHVSKNLSSWAERTPVAVAIDQERNMTTPLACKSTVTKLPKSPHPRALQASLSTTQVFVPLNHYGASVKSPFVPSSLARENQSVGIATNTHNNMAATPKGGCISIINDHKNVEKWTPGSKQPFSNLPPIFAPTLMKSKSKSPDKPPPSNGQSQSTELDCGAGTPVIFGFEDDFVPFNAHDNENLSPNQVEHDATYHIDKESSVSLNRTYTRALSELEEEDGVVDGGGSKAAARKVGQEIWQKVKNIDYPPPERQPTKSHPLSSIQCDGEQKKIPGYLTMTKSAASKRLPATRQPLLKSNKENIPGGRKRTNTMKQSNRTIRPLARSVSLKSRPVSFNW